MNWMTAIELTERYMVLEQRLGEYAARGNLPFRKTDAGVLYDESVAKRFFRPRQGSAQRACVMAPQPQSMGVLGTTRLGDALRLTGESDLGVTPSARQRSRRLAGAQLAAAAAIDAPFRDAQKAAG